MERDLIHLIVQGTPEEIQDAKLVFRMIQDFHLLGVPILQGAHQVLELFEIKKSEK